MKQYIALKSINIFTESVAIGEKTIAVIDTEIPGLKKLVWNSYISDVTEISEAIKNGWIQEVKQTEYNPNGSLKYMPEKDSDFYFVDSDFDVMSNVFNHPHDKFYILTQNCFDTKEAVQRWCDKLKRLADNDCQEEEKPKVTRVEVIEKNLGRQYVEHDIENCELSYQDDGRTLKIFINR